MQQAKEQSVDPRLPTDHLPGRTIHIILIEDHTIVRAGLRLIFDQLPDVHVVGEAASGDDGVRLFERLQRHGDPVDVVVSDLGLPDFSGLEVSRRIKAQCPEARVLILSMYADQEHIAGLLDSGVDGYLLKLSSTTELAEGIRAVARGEMVLAPAVARHLFNHVQRRQQSEATAQTVTDREREILELLARGFSSKEIASKLHRSIKTVGNHRMHILEKLGAANTAEAIGRAYQLGLIEPPNGR